ncbi:MAG: hypothetical protein AABZ44_08445 [Elusimicrobiota bacterium]
MKNNKPLFLAAILTALLPQGLPALTLEDLNAGARIVGLGGSYAALADGLGSVFVNPAGLVSVRNEEIAGGFGQYYTLPAGQYHFGYGRDLFEDISVAGSWQGIHSSEQHLDRFYFSWAQTQNMGSYFSPDHKFSWGLGLHSLSVRSRALAQESFKSALGIGIDFGALLFLHDGRTGVGVSIMGVDAGSLDLDGPYGTLGLSRRLGSFRAMIDFKARQGLTMVYPAVETTLYNDLLRLRIGRGARFGESSMVALGAGFNLRPLTVDFAVHMSPEGLHKREGAYFVSAGYAFGGPKFYENFTGRAATEAQQLSGQVDRLKKQRMTSADELAGIEADLAVLRQEIKAMEERKREEYATMELMRNKQSYDEQQQKESRRAKEEKRRQEEEAARPKDWPKRHRVVEGDTLRRLATTYYGDPELWELIYKENLKKIERGLPQVGTILLLPDPASLGRARD